MQDPSEAGVDVSIVAGAPDFMWSTADRASAGCSAEEQLGASGCADAVASGSVLTQHSARETMVLALDPNEHF